MARPSDIIKRAIWLDAEAGSRHLSSTELSALGWVFDIVTDKQAVGATLRQGDHGVGVIVFCERTLDFADPKLFEQTHNVKWIALVERETLGKPIIRELISHYFYDYHTLPLDPRRLAITLGRAHGMATLVPADQDTEWCSVFGAVAQSEAMQRFGDRLRRIAVTANDILIVGASGTGKELAARAIHRLSARRDGPFVPVDCSTLPDQLAYAELFGSEAGAFSGASERRIGKLEAADTGTVLLDEIGSLPLQHQSKLLRFLDERTFTRLGSNRMHFVDARVITTTNREPRELLESGAIRHDLYYRIDAVRLRVPSLSERHGDIGLLANLFLDRYCQSNFMRRNPGFTQEALRLLNAYSWPGNVRELENTVRRAAFMREGRRIRAEDLNLTRSDTEPVPTLLDARNAAEREAMVQAISFAAGNLSKAARTLGLSRVTFYRLLKKHNLSASAVGER